MQGNEGRSSHFKVWNQAGEKCDVNNINNKQGPAYMTRFYNTGHYSYISKHPNPYKICCAERIFFSRALNRSYMSGYDSEQTK